MKLDELINISKIDFSDCFAELDSGTRLNYSFDISPSEFLSFAKSDLREGEKRGVINSLTNAKRAIDCQIDLIFKSFGYEFDQLPESLQDFCEYFCEDERSKDLPYKLKVINAFGMAPAGLVSKARTLRNKLEHFYNIPTDEEVRNAIEIAELFISATEKHLMNFWGFELTDAKHKKNVESDKLSGLYIIDKPDSDLYCLEVNYYCPYTKKRYTVDVTPDNSSYAPLMRMCISSDQDEEFRRSLIYLLKLNAHKIPQKNVNIYIK